MKKKSVMGMLAVVLTVAVMCGCGKQEEPVETVTFDTEVSLESGVETTSEVGEAITQAEEKYIYRQMENPSWDYYHENGTQEMSQHALTQIQHIYKIERQCDEAGLSYDERRQTRQELSRPIMEAMKVWMETEGIKYSPSSLTGKAITYAYTKWDNIMRCLDDGRLYWDNNLAENVQRPITLSRKNFLFCGNHEAAVNMSVICSLLATCKAHDVNPRVYLNDVIAQMPYHKKATQEELLNLLPHKWKLKHPECVLTKQKEESCN